MTLLGFEELMVQDYEGSFLIKKKVSNFKVKFMRIVDGEVTEGPIDLHCSRRHKYKEEACDHFGDYFDYSGNALP